MTTPDDRLQQARQELGMRSNQFAAAKGEERGAAWVALCVAAEGYAKATWAVKAPAKGNYGQGESGKSPTLVPYGRDKGKSISDIDKRALEWLTRTLQENVDDPAREKYREQNQRTLDKVRAELESR